MSREEELFATVRLLPPAERADYLDRECGGDSALRARIEELLAGYEESQRALATPFVTRGRDALEEAPGHRIGRYKLLQKIGEGGCGVVWMAEQEEPVRRRVALKVIKLGMDTKAVIARFEAERQALAMMDHPNIARVFDAGATDTGRPFFVMELVRGISITRYCDDNQLTPAARLELFVRICHAVQHAHQKGIIHRDLKPSNILVTVNDDVPTPKIIDFGVAKATQGRLTDSTLFTAFEQFIGTPVYMSPEQAELSSVDIDTRSDIYSLGILLYELLTGRPPFDPKTFAKAAVAEIRHHIREDEPPKPSARWRTLGDAERTTLARLRNTQPSRLSIILRGDLDWIVMRCLEKNRTRRYDTASALAADIERHLRHEPVAARPPGTGYLVRKWIRRHRLGFAAAAAVAVVLALGIATSTWQAWRAAQAERHAVAMQRVAEAQALSERRRGYASDMLLAQVALDQENCVGARELLDRHRPAAGQSDLRDWEWRWLWKRSQPETDEVLGNVSAPDQGGGPPSRSIWSLASSRDGNWLAAGTFGTEAGGVVAVWHLKRRQKFEFRVGDGYTRVAFSPVEPLLAVSAHTSEDPPRSWVELWRCEDTADGLVRHVEQRLELGEDCSALRFSQDGTTLVTSTFGEWEARKREPTVTCWNVRDGCRLRSIRVPETKRDYGRHYHFAISPDLRFAAYETANPTEFRVIDLRTGVEQWHCDELDGGSVPFAFSPDSTLLASGDGWGGTLIHLWDVASGKELGRYEGHRDFVASLAFWPDGNTLASGSLDGTIRLWQVPERAQLSVHGSGFAKKGGGFGSWKAFRTFRAHGARQLDVLAGPGLLVNCDGRTVYLWKAASETDTADRLERARAMTRRHDSAFADFSGVQPKLGIGSATIEDFANEEPTELRWVIGWRFAGDSRAVLTVDPGGTLHEWGIPGFREKRTVSIEALETFCRGLSLPERQVLPQLLVPPALFAPGRPLVAIGSGGTGKVLVFDFERRSLMCEIKVSSGNVLPICFLSDSTRLLLYDPGLSASTVQEWDLERGVEIATWVVPQRPSPVFAVTPDERHVLTLSRDGIGLVRDRIARTSLDVKLAPGLAVGFSPNGRILAVAALGTRGEPSHAKLWNFPQLTERGRLSHLSDGMLSVGFTPNGGRFVGGSRRTVAFGMWDVESGQPLLTLPLEGREFFTPPAFSPDGSVLGALCSNRRLFLWRAPSWEEIEAAEKAARSPRSDESRKAGHPGAQ